MATDTLANLDVTTEIIAPLQAIFHTDYSAKIKALDGQEVEVMGRLPARGRVGA